MKWWFIHGVYMNTYMYIYMWLPRESTVPTFVGPLVPRDVWLVIWTPGGTLMKERENGVLVCLPSQAKNWLYIHMYLYTYNSIYNRVYIYIHTYTHGIWMYLRYVTICFMSAATSGVFPRCWPEACPTANRWSSNCAATSTWHDGGIFFPFLVHDSHDDRVCPCVCVLCMGIVCLFI